ncbi:MAG: hypothetical protein NDI93_18985 [Pseudomonas sp.]|nr:hypothetical protein [Pseudomonas sp.]
MIRELNDQEIIDINGGGFFYDALYALGFVTGAGAATQQHIDSLADPMLGAMQYGA